MKRSILLVTETDDADSVSDKDLIRMISESLDMVDDCVKHIKVTLLT